MSWPGRTNGSANAWLDIADSAWCLLKETSCFVSCSGKPDESILPRSFHRYSGMMLELPTAISARQNRDPPEMDEIGAAMRPRAFSSSKSSALPAVSDKAAKRGLFIWLSKLDGVRPAAEADPERPSNGQLLTACLPLGTAKLTDHCLSKAAYEKDQLLQQPPNTVRKWRYLHAVAMPIKGGYQDYLTSVSIPMALARLIHA